MLKHMELRSYAFDCYAWTLRKKIVKCVFSTLSQGYATISIFDTVCLIIFQRLEHMDAGPYAFVILEFVILDFYLHSLNLLHSCL